jgi:hypothetical protein
MRGESNKPRTVLGNPVDKIASGTKDFTTVIIRLAEKSFGRYAAPGK